MFIYDISQGAPVQKQVVTIPNSYNGITFDPLRHGRRHVSGGMGDYPFFNGGTNGLDIVASRSSPNRH